MNKVKRDIADIKRFKQIIAISAEEGLGYFFEKINLSNYIPFGKKKYGGRAVDEPTEKRLRRTLERLGPTFIKFGQILSVRPDLLPRRYIQELEKLQDNVNPISKADAKGVFEKSTGKKIETVFKKFYARPVASASIAQVHKAVLLDGKVVAVKIKRPGIEEMMKRDLEILQFIAKFAEKNYPAVRKYKLTEIVSEFADWTIKELDFDQERENMYIFLHNFKESETTVIPKAFGEYSSRDALVMEFIEGVPLHNATKKNVQNLKKMMENGIDSVLEQVFIYGFFHADPHPSNILVTKDNMVAFVDFGIVGRFSEALRQKSFELFLSVVNGEGENAAEILLDISKVDADCDVEQFKRRIDEIISPLKYENIKNIKVSKRLERAFDVSLDSGIRIPREFVIFGKTIVTIEGIGLMYYPDFKFEECLNPIITKIILNNYNPNKITKQSVLGFLRLRNLVDRLPYQTKKLLDKLDKGRIKIEMKDSDIKRLSIEIDKSSNRLTYAMIIASLFISGSLVINVGEKVFYGLPLLAALCFVAAFMVGGILFISIILENKGGEINEKSN